jgi:sulfite reductase alpha subunit-like flavoprotein
MRAFVEERIASGEAKGAHVDDNRHPFYDAHSACDADTALYFGCRSKDKDLYFAQEMKAWKEAGVHVRVACSRDQVRDNVHQSVFWC